MKGIYMKTCTHCKKQVTPRRSLTTKLYYFPREEPADSAKLEDYIPAPSTIPVTLCSSDCLIQAQANVVDHEGIIKTYEEHKALKARREAV